MQNSIIPVVCISAALACLASTASAKTTFLRDCHFDKYYHVTDKGTDNGGTDWHLKATHRGTSARIEVAGSGNYDAMAKTHSSGGIKYVFKTVSSKEIITASPKGEALWDIRFNNGDLLVYSGMCQPAKVTSQ